jgi:hypothetical protein
MSEALVGTCKATWAMMWLSSCYEIAQVTLQGSTKGCIIFSLLGLFISRSAHQTPNFTNPEFQFPQLKELQSGFFLLRY